MKERNQVIGDYYTKSRSSLIKKVSGRAATPENAEDIVHNAFVKALQYWGSYDPKVKGLDEWFGCILNNSLKDFMRDERNYGMSMEFDEEEIEGIEMSSLSDDIKQKIKKEIGFASLKNQKVLSLYYVQGHSVAEITQITDLKPKHVKLIAQRFRDHMQERYKAKV